MTLFTDALLDDLRRLPGASYSFLKQLADDDAAAHRQWLEAQVQRAPAALADRWVDVLGSLDNRRFFQGYAELATTTVLQRIGWRVTDLVWPGPSLAARDPAGSPFHLMPLGFVRQVRPADREAIARLARALNRVASRSRITVMVRRWLPHDFDPEPVRQAVDMWLREVDRAGWDGRYAEYRDDHVSLEFALTGERARKGQGVVALVLGPFDADRVMQTLERRLVDELDAWRLSAWAAHPVIVCCVADQPWGLPPGYLRELLYGKPVRQCTQPWDPRYTATFGPEFTPCLFRDPLYEALAGVVFIERRPDRVDPVAATAFINPWCERPVAVDAMPGRVFAVHHLDANRPVMAWVDPPGP